MKIKEKIRIYPGELNGIVHIPPSKSLSHRVIIAASLAEGHGRIDNLVYSEDIDATLEAMEILGAAVVRDKSAVSISGIGKYQAQDVADGSLPNQVSHNRVIRCNESGSTLRFLIPIATAMHSHLRFEGRGKLISRPIDAYFPIFEASGMAYTYKGELPLITSGKLSGGSYVIKGDVSSQYVTGLLMAAPLLTEDTEIVIEGELESKGYVDLTLDVLSSFGIEFERQGYRVFRISGNQVYRAKNYTVEGDYSQSAFWIVAALLGSRIGLSGLKRESSQGDRAVIDIVENMGGKLSYDKDLLVVNRSATRGVIIDASEIPDLIPALCVLAAFSEGETVVHSGARLRIKESDRIKTTVDILSQMGADITETKDGMVVRGKRQLEGGVTVQGHGDHRIVMAATIAATHCRKPVVIEGCGAVKKSYPHFFEDFKKLGGHLEEL